MYKSRNRKVFRQLGYTAVGFGPDMLDPIESNRFEILMRTLIGEDYIVGVDKVLWLSLFRNNHMNLNWHLCGGELTDCCKAVLHREFGYSKEFGDQKCWTPSDRNF